MRDQSIFDIEVDLDDLLVGEDGLWNYFYLQELKQRRIFLNDDISQYTVFPIVKNIMQFNVEDKGKPVEERRPIMLYITSCGGSMDDGFELIDVIRASKTPIYTINTGYAYSMGFLIMLAGHKRLSMPSSKFLLHDGSNFAYGSSAKIKDQIKFQERVEARIRDYILGRTSISGREYDKNYRTEWYMLADEAKEKGVIDQIIGVDADIDSIL